MTQLKTLSEKERRLFYSNNLVIFDDMVADIKRNEFNPMLTKLFLNRRHLVHNGMVSIIIISQKYTMIPSRIRSNSNWVIFFRVNPSDNDLIYRDAVPLCKE